MKKETLRLYRRFRETGYRADESIRGAKIVAKFDELEMDGLVRLQTQAERENYFDVYGKPGGYVDGYGRRVSAKQEYEELAAEIDRHGCYHVYSEFFDGTEWQFVDSLGMRVCNDPTSPFENCCVSDLMQAAIVSLQAFWEAEQPGEYDFAELEESI